MLNKQIEQWHDFNQRYLDGTKLEIERLTTEAALSEQKMTEAESKIDKNLNEDAEKKREFATKVEQELNENKKDFS